MIITDGRRTIKVKVLWTRKDISHQEFVENEILSDLKSDENGYYVAEDVDDVISYVMEYCNNPEHEDYYQPSITEGDKVIINIPAFGPWVADIFHLEDMKGDFDIRENIYSVQDAKGAKEQLLDFLYELGTEEDREAFNADEPYQGEDEDVRSCFDQRDLLKGAEVVIWRDGDIVEAVMLEEGTYLDGRVVIKG